jgi:hypothetical protein
MEAYEQAKEELGGLASLGDDMGALTGYLRRKLLRTCCCCCESGRRAREQHLANINLLTDERGFSINLPLASDLGLITAVKQVARRVYWEEIPRHEMTHAKFSRMMLEAWAEMAKSGKKTTTLFCLCVCGVCVCVWGGGGGTTIYDPDNETIIYQDRLGTNRRKREGTRVLFPQASSRRLTRMTCKTSSPGMRST